MDDFNQYRRARAAGKAARIVAMVYILLCLGAALACNIGCFFRLPYSMNLLVCNLLLAQSAVIWLIVCAWFYRKYHTKIIITYIPFVDTLFLVFLVYAALICFTGPRGVPQAIGVNEYVINYRNLSIPVSHDQYLQFANIYKLQAIKSRTAIGMLVNWTAFMLLISRNTERPKYKFIYRFLCNLRFGRRP